MQHSDSKAMYLNVVNLNTNHSNNFRSKMNTYPHQNNINSGKFSYNQQNDLGTSYVNIIKMMAEELLNKKTSSLLSHLCSDYSIEYKPTNFNLMQQGHIYINYNELAPHLFCDTIIIISGLEAFFYKGEEGCKEIFKSRIDEVFRNRVYNSDQKIKFMESLVGLLKSIDSILHKKSYQSNVKIDQIAYKANKVIEENTPKTMMTSYDQKISEKLNQFAETRKASDAALSEQIQQIQVKLQEELKLIMKIREDIEYNTTLEPINQLIHLFNLLYDPLKYHMKKVGDNNYNNLIESCEDFQNHIQQSLSMLGVTIINEAQKPFDSEKHKTVRGVQPNRSSIISKVIKVGFSYKNKVLQKAEVEL
jgi:molecular chaperone GrpE (heat shock protein)